MIPLRCIIVQEICELKQGRKERTGSRRFFLMGTHFFPFGDASQAAGIPKKIEWGRRGEANHLCGRSKFGNDAA